MMNIIKRWIEARKEKQREFEADNLVWHKNKIDCENKSIAEFERAMFSLPCPLSDGNCRSKCVHFLPGYISELPQIGGGVFIAATMPRCLLWHK